MIYILENKMSEDTCKKYIYFYKYAKWLRQESKVSSELHDTNIFSDIRKSEYIRLFKNYHFYEEVNEIYQFIYNNAIKLFNFDLYRSEDMFEDIKIIKYKKGDYFDWHYDCFNKTSKTRKINFTIQLNEDYKGGDLEFFKFDIPENKKKGTVILYPSFLPHRIIPISKGIRYCIVGHLNGPEFR